MTARPMMSHVEFGCQTKAGRWHWETGPTPLTATKAYSWLTAAEIIPAVGLHQRRSA